METLISFSSIFLPYSFLPTFLGGGTTGEGDNKKRKKENPFSFYFQNDINSSEGFLLF